MWDSLATWFVVGFLTGYVVSRLVLGSGLGPCFLPGIRHGACRTTRGLDERPSTLGER
jgi:hypothetical protein